jgi:hypothetical protein
VMAAKGRHDPCVVTRAIPIVEAMAALVLADCAMQQISREAAMPNPAPDKYLVIPKIPEDRVAAAAAKAKAAGAPEPVATAGFNTDSAKRPANSDVESNAKRAK